MKAMSVICLSNVNAAKWKGLTACTFDVDDEVELVHSPVTDTVSVYGRILRACIDAYGHGNISVFSVTLQFEFMKQTVGKDVDNVNEHQGTSGVLRLRGEVRKAARVDLDKAVGRNGGFGSVAFKVNLSLALKEREPRSSWNKLQNLHREILLFQEGHVKDGKHMRPDGF